MFFSLFIACVGESFQGEEGSILAIGDSMLAWNLEEEQSIPEVVGRELDIEVHNVSVSGAYISSDDTDSHIPSQYDTGGWSWVVMNGGGNDLNDECGCGDCTENLNSILSEDGEEGELFDLVQQIVDDGSRVALVGYFSMPEQAEYGFSECNDELEILVERTSRMTEKLDGVLFLDSREVISYEETPEAYDEDFVHPSIEGGGLIGAEVAAMIRDAQ
jgi:acyl-CoA thioesterase I